MYDAFVDTACYPGTSILRNIPGLHSQQALDRFEAVATGRRFMEPMPAGRLSVSHYRAIHRHIFQDVYPWAGRLRTVRISKGASTFCYPEHIRTELNRVFGDLRRARFLRELAPSVFMVGAAHFLAELNAIHPFRDGNGRAQLAFMAILAHQAGHSLDLGRLDPKAFLEAMVLSFAGNERHLQEQLRGLLA